MTSVFVLIHKDARQAAMKSVMLAPDESTVEIREPRRSDDQNSLLWVLLGKISANIPWDGEKLTPNEYKDLLTACLRKQKVVRGVEGGLVFLGARTSTMTKSEFSDLIELIYSFAAERGLVL